MLKGIASQSGYGNLNGINIGESQGLQGIRHGCRYLEIQGVYHNVDIGIDGSKISQFLIGAGTCYQEYQRRNGSVLKALCIHMVNNLNIVQIEVRYIVLQGSTVCMAVFHCNDISLRSH